MEKSYTEKLSNLSLLASLAKVDNKVSKIELDFYLVVARKLGVEQQDYERVFQEGSAFEPSVDETSRVVLFHKLIILCFIDDKIADEEIEFCYNLGLKLGLNNSAIHTILIKLKDEPKLAIDPEGVNEIFKTSLN